MSRDRAEGPPEGAAADRPEDTEARRSELLASWERASVGWGELAARIRSWGMPVSAWLVEQLDLQPGERVLELAAGPGDTGFMAAELIRPGGVLVSSDGTEGMLGVARQRAAELGITNVEFKQLQLEWIDLPTASVDAAICRWGVMLVVDPASALGEIRRVLKPEGRCALAVWDAAERNPWGTIPGQAAVELGLAPPPDPTMPNPFSLGDPDHFREMLSEAGFVQVEVDTIELPRTHSDVEQYVFELPRLSSAFGQLLSRLGEADRQKLRERISEKCAPFLQPDGSLRLPGSCLVALAHS